MPAYIIGKIEITNPAGFEPYRAAAPTTVAQYAGRLLTRAGITELLEVGPEPKGTAILEFADTAAVKRWYHSPEYCRSGSPTRRAASSLFEGVS